MEVRNILASQHCPAKMFNMTKFAILTVSVEFLGTLNFRVGFSKLPCGFICCFFISRNQIDHSEPIGNLFAGSNEF